MIREMHDGSAIARGEFHTARVGWLLGILASILLSATACANFTPESPANQRFWDDEDRFVVLHWDASPKARRYVVYHSNDTGERGHREIGETESTTAAVLMEEWFYRDCTETNPCGETWTAEEEGVVHHFLVSACNMFGCSDVGIHLEPARKLSAPEDNAPPTPGKVKAEKHVQSGGPDDACVTWRRVDGATYYNVLTAHSPDEDFKFAESVPSTGIGEPVFIDYRAFSDTPGRHQSCWHNTGTWGEYSATSWTIEACTRGGCSPRSRIVSVR